MDEYAALLKATAQVVWDEEEPSDGHLDTVWLSLAVIVPAVTAEVRALHKRYSATLMATTARPETATTKATARSRPPRSASRAALPSWTTTCSTPARPSVCSMSSTRP